jgi:hypothetical protein
VPCAVAPHPPPHPTRTPLHALCPAQAAKQRREDVGVELYGFQQNLAKLQLQLEQTQQSYEAIGDIRARAEQELGALRKQLEEQQGLNKQEAAKVGSGPRGGGGSELGAAVPGTAGLCVLLLPAAAGCLASASSSHSLAGGRLGAMPLQGPHAPLPRLGDHRTRSPPPPPPPPPPPAPTSHCPPPAARRSSRSRPSWTSWRWR